jgi:hypothetical protein
MTGMLVEGIFNNIERKPWKLEGIFVFHTLTVVRSKYNSRRSNMFQSVSQS